MGLEKQSRPKRLRHNLLLDNGPPGLQVKFFYVKIVFDSLFDFFIFQVKSILEAYSERTAEQRDGQSGLFISLNRPFGTVKTVTTRNIFIYAMGIANIDISIFGPHSARASVSSAPGLSLKQILELGCWRSASTFQNHYQAEFLE